MQWCYGRVGLPRGGRDGGVISRSIMGGNINSCLLVEEFVLFCQ